MKNDTVGGEVPPQFKPERKRSEPIRYLAEEYHQYSQAVKAVHAMGDMPLDICALNQLLVHDGGKLLPDREIQQGVKIFYFGYKLALTTDLSLELGQKHVTIDWCIAAFGRYLRPFTRGNSVVFHLIENHLRLRHGLPWREHLVPTEIFQDFRARGFYRVFPHLIQSELAELEGAI